MLIQFIDIAISDLFVKYQRHHNKTTKLQSQAALICIWCGYSFAILYIIQNTLLHVATNGYSHAWCSFYIIPLREYTCMYLLISPPSTLQPQTSATLATVHRKKIHYRNFVAHVTKDSSNESSCELEIEKTF